jgi:dienelactone hydrolase
MKLRVTAVAMGTAVCMLAIGIEARQTPGAPGAPQVPWVPPDTPKGTGRYKAIMEMDAMLPTHTVYRPGNLSALGGTKLPVIAWGNGACVNAGNRFRHFLTEIASHGYLVVAIGPVGPRNMEEAPQAPAARAGGAPPGAEGAAPGRGRAAGDGAAPPPGARGRAAGDAPPGGARAGGPPAGPATRLAQLNEALDWALAENTRRGSKYFGKLDTENVAIMGQSCGGVQAIGASTDPRVTVTVGWNTGLFADRGADRPAMEDVPKTTLDRLHAPIAYFTGDPGDVAYPNAADDYKRLEAAGKIPALHAWKDGMPHTGTYREENGGEMGRIAVAYLAWRMKGDETAGKMFKGSTCGLCTTPGWHVSKSKID